MTALVKCEAGLVYVLLPDCDLLPGLATHDDVLGTIPCYIGTNLDEALRALRRNGARIVFDVGGSVHA